MNWFSKKWCAVVRKRGGKHKYWCDVCTRCGHRKVSRPRKASAEVAAP